MSLRALFINPILSKTDFESPLGLLYISKVCSLAGYKTKIVDLSFEYDLNYLKDYLSSNVFDVVGIYAMSPMIHNGLKAAQIVKNANPGIKTIFGGPHPTLFPEEVLSNKYVDFVVMGEGEETLPELLNSIDNSHAYFDIRGIGFKYRDRLIINERRELINNLDALPFPDRSELDTLAGYINLSGIKILFGQRTLNIIASRGCHFNCAFCQPALRKIHGPKVRSRSVDNVIDEIDYMKRRWKIDAAWFEDDTMTFKKDWILRFCDAMVTRNIDIGWSCNSRLDTIDSDILMAMKRANCLQIRYGLESGSQVVLDKDFKKGIKIANIKKVFDMTHEIGIKTYCYVMIGGRHETLDSIEETRKFLKTISPGHIQLAITTPLPHTKLREEVESDRDVRIISGAYEDIKLFEKCNFDTKYLKARDLELIYRRIFNELHFFRFSSLINRDILAWIKRNLEFAIFLIRSKKNKRLLFASGIFLSYLKLCIRLLFLKTPFLKYLDGFIFRKRLSFPPFG